MNIRQAILKAADHIEGNPKGFHFMQNNVPHECGSPGCALGWIGFYLGMRGGVSIGAEVVPSVMGGAFRDGVFYDRMDELVGNEWIDHPAMCANGLRLYADKYHPAKSRALIPASVRAIFDMTPAQLAREFERV